MELTKELKEKIDAYLKNKTPKELLDLFKKHGMEEIPKQLSLTDVVSSACDDYQEGINMQCAKCDEPKYKHRN